MNDFLRELKNIAKYKFKMNGSYVFTYKQYKINIAPNYGGVWGFNIILRDEKAKKHIGTYVLRKA